MKKITYRMWDIVYPILFYYMISGVVFFALGMILGSKQEIYMVKQLLASGATIPFLVSLWKQECSAAQVVYGKSNRSFSMRVVEVFLSCVTVGCFGAALNNFIAMTPLMQASSGFQTANENFFAGTMIVEILASCAVVPMAEELLFRGIVQKRCTSLAGEKAGIFFSALLFGIIHINLVQFLYAAGVGLILGLIVQKTRKVSLAIWGHAAANLIAIIRAETEILSFAYEPDLAGIGSSFLLVCVGLMAGRCLVNNGK